MFVRAVIVLVLSFATVANAAQIYDEDFLGEVGFPTTPEVDPTGIGGLSAFASGEGPPALPTIDGSEGILTLAAQGSLGPSPEVAAVAAGGGTFGPSIGFFEVSATFQNFSSVFAGIGAVQANIGVVDALASANVLAILSDGSSGLMDIIVLEQTIGVAGNDQLRVTLPDSVRTAVLGGASYDIDLLVDRQLGIAEASLQIGSDVFSTPSLNLTRLGSKDIASIIVTALVLDFLDDPLVGPPIDFGADDSVSVELVELRAAVPEPSSALLLAIGLTGLAARRAPRRALCA